MFDSDNIHYEDSDDSAAELVKDNSDFRSNNLINLFNSNVVNFKYNYIIRIQYDSDNEYYDLFNLFYYYKYFKKIVMHYNSEFKYSSTLSFNFTIRLFFIKMCITNIKDKAMFSRSLSLISQIRSLFKKLKLVKFKKKRKSALIIFRRRKFFSFIKLRNRYFKSWRSKIKFNSNRRIYKLTLNRLTNFLRVYLIQFLFSSFSKKKLMPLNRDLESFSKNKFLYNFNLPFFNDFDVKQKYLFYKNINVLKNKYFPKLFLFFVSNFFEKLTRQKVFIKLNTNPILSKFENILVQYFSKKFFFFQKQFRGTLHLNEFVYILIISLKNKDLFFLRNWLINFLEKINLKKHKSFLRGFKRLILSILTLSSKFLKTEGFFFDIRGKVGVAGNAKKRHFSIKYKNYGFTKIELRAEQLKFLVRTNTGVLGLTLILTY